MPAHVAGDGARISIESTACGETNDDANRFAAVEILVSRGGAR